MQIVPKITDAEWEVMKVVWLRRSFSTANEIVDELSKTTNWKPNTIKTLISRLVKKKVLGYKEEGRTHLYFPLVQEEECVKAESKSFLKRVYGGALKPLLVNFLSEERLTTDEIEELKRLLEERTE